MEAQGHGGICQNVLEQDNGSAMKLEINGRTSAGPSRSRHIDIRYFWITDRIRSKGKRIWHFPASEMLGDSLPDSCNVAYSERSGMSY
jgi:hypothetical protein